MITLAIKRLFIKSFKITAMSRKFTTQEEEELHNDFKIILEMISTSKHTIADVSLLQLKIKAVELKEKHNIK